MQLRINHVTSFIKRESQKGLIHFQSHKSHCSKTQSQNCQQIEAQFQLVCSCTNDKRNFCQKDVKKKNSLLTIFIFSFFSPGDLQSDFTLTIRCESYYIWYLVDISYFCLEKRQKLPNVLLALGMSIRDNEIRDNQKKFRVTLHIQNLR